MERELARLSPIYRMYDQDQSWVPNVGFNAFSNKSGNCRDVRLRTKCGLIGCMWQIYSRGAGNSSEPIEGCHMLVQPLVDLLIRSTAKFYSCKKLSHPSSSSCLVGDVPIVYFERGRSRKLPKFSGAARAKRRKIFAAGLFRCTGWHIAGVSRGEELMPLSCNVRPEMTRRALQCSGLRQTKLRACCRNLSASSGAESLIIFPHSSSDVGFRLGAKLKLWFHARSLPILPEVPK